MVVMPEVTEVMLHLSDMKPGSDCSVITTGYVEKAFMPPVTAVLLLHSNMDTVTDYSVVSTG